MFFYNIGIKLSDCMELSSRFSGVRQRDWSVGGWMDYWISIDRSNNAFAINGYLLSISLSYVIQLDSN